MSSKNLSDTQNEIIELSAANENDDDFNEHSRFLKNREKSSPNGMPDDDEVDLEDRCMDLKESGYEQSLAMIGFGKFHYVLTILCGMANASDAIEILCVSFILPTAQCELNMSSADKGFLSAITFAGMMIGGYTWGTMGDIYGRKYVLIAALLINAIFGVLAGLSQSFQSLLIFRLLSGVGVGGSVPIVWSYFSEFLHKDIRGRILCCLASAWLFGNLLVIALAYFILTYVTGTWTFFSGSLVINSWRLFMMACAVPSLITATLFFFLPESPKFCIYNNKGNKGSKILSKIYTINNKCVTHSDFERRKNAFFFFERYENSMKPYSIENDDALDDQTSLSREYLVNAVTNPSNKSRLQVLIHGTKNMIIKSFSIFRKPYTFNSFVNLYITFALYFSYYGLWMWLPELYKRMNIYGGTACKIGTVPIHNGTTTAGNDVECHLSSDVFRSSTFSALSNLPGNVFTILCIDRVGRNKVTSFSLIASGLTIFAIPFTTTESQGVFLTVIFGGINVLTFNSFGCTCTEIYPTKLRSTALGVQSVAGRWGAIFGNILFGLAVDSSCYLPLMTITILLVSSGLLSLKLPESTRKNTN